MAAELVAGAVRLSAEAFLSSLFQVIFERLASDDFKDYFRRGNLERLVDKLESTLSSINQVLDDAEIKQYESPGVKKWLGDVKHAMYEADQLLDEIAADAPLKKLKAESSSIVSGFFPAFTNPFESRIKELLKNLDSLAGQKDKLELKEGTCARNKVGLSPKPSKGEPTTSLVDKSGIYGRDGDKEEIIKFLRSENDRGNQVPVISIVGLGGMGKTTLAKFVYNDQEMQKHFELKAWVYVSESFDVIGLTKEILRSFQFSADGEDLTTKKNKKIKKYGEDLNILQHQLQQIIIGKKYLLVLDDVWNPNEESWEQLLLPFNHGSSGSKIIVTTRDKEAASIMKSTQLLHLQELEKSNCWLLFVKHAFHGRNVSEYPNLESIGKKILDKCGGLPLAVKTLGNLLRRKFSQRDEWLKILETDLWCLSDGGSNINRVLRLSYHNLPSNLKRCFDYCSIFPKGYVFHKDRLIKLWMAEGLLKCHRTDKSEEELGNEFFDDLESISFFQQATSSWFDDDEDVFVMHDLVNDLANSVSGEFCYRIEDDRVHDIPERTRHIWCSLDLNDGDRILEQIYKIKGLRSLIIETAEVSNNVQHDLFRRLKYLRMLSLSNCDLSELADEISNLKLLRYLDLSLNEITRLPGSICMLYNLQTLLLQYCRLTELPSDFCKLVNLRHLDMSYIGIKKMPKHIGRLNHLQILNLDFVVGEHNGSDIKELAELNRLQGKLRIKGLENVIDSADAAAAKLKDKKHLEELFMIYSYTRETDDSIMESDVFVLEALQPNSNISGLEIGHYYGSSFPNWLRVCHLPNLVSLKLDGCKFCSMLPPLGNLPFLKELSIFFCFEIKIIGEEFYGNNSSNVPFRSLEILRFMGMSNWKEWLCLEGCFPLLKELSIWWCPKLKSSLPQNLPSLQKLVILDCQELEASIPKAANISELELERCENILVNESLSSLKRATVVGNRWHSSSFPLALHLFTNLHSLELHDCPELESFPGGGFPSSLSSLEIDKCPKLIASREEWRLFELNSLKEFIVSDDFENVESFPEERLLPPTLNSLKLVRCSKLRILNNKGLLHLESLESLCIQDCPCLERLPEEGLPNSLSTLKIIRCSLLKQQYEKEKGERWNIIQHIPTVFCMD